MVTTESEAVSRRQALRVAGCGLLAGSLPSTALRPETPKALPVAASVPIALTSPALPHYLLAGEFGAAYERAEIIRAVVVRSQMNKGTPSSDELALLWERLHELENASEGFLRGIIDQRLGADASAPLSGGIEGPLRVLLQTPEGKLSVTRQIERLPDGDELRAAVHILLKGWPNQAAPASLCRLVGLRPNSSLRDLRGVFSERAFQPVLTRWQDIPRWNDLASTQRVWRSILGVSFSCNSSDDCGLPVTHTGSASTRAEWRRFTAGPDSRPFEKLWIAAYLLYARLPDIGLFADNCRVTLDTQRMAVSLSLPDEVFRDGEAQKLLSRYLGTRSDSLQLARKQAMKDLYSEFRMHSHEIPVERV